MERKLLTAEIAACYWGCMVEETKQGLNDSEWQERYIPSSIGGGEYYNSEYQDIPFKRFQLILMPLSEITDEHAIEVAKICRPEIYDTHHLLNIGTNVVADLLNKFVIIEWGSNKIQALIDYLRSKSYDLGHGQIESLIEAGIAIKKD